MQESPAHVGAGTIYVRLMNKDVKLMNLCVRRGYGTEKISKKRLDDDGQPIEGKYEWINAPPRPRKTEYGDPPVPE